MATYVNDLRLKEIATGDESGTWGTSTNTNLELIAEAFSFGTEAITTNADTHTTTIADGSTDPGRSIFLKYTGTLDSACTITIGPNTVSKLWLIENATSGSQNIIISQGSGANITIANGQTKAIYSDGAGSGAAMVDAFQDLSIPDLFIDDDLTFTSDSAVITFGADGDTTLTHTDGSGLTLNSTNKIMFNDASQFIQGSSATVLSLGATDEIDLTATAIDVNGTMDVSGTLGVTGIVTLADDLIIGDGKTIGSASDVDAMTIASNGQVTFTQTLIGTALDISGDIDVDGTTNLDVVDIDGAVDMASTLQVDGAITSSAGATITTADNLTQLTLISTDADANKGPVLDLYRNSSSPADADATGRINFQGENSAGETITYSQIFSSIIDVTDGTEDGRYKIGTMLAGSFDSRMDMINTETVFNDDSKDLDFRVESDGNANMFLVDAGNNRVQIANLLLGEITGSTDVIQSTSTDGLLIDVAGDITLDAGGQQIILKDDGTTFAEIYQASSSLYIESKVSDADIFFRGNDGGSDITALTLDMSAAGAAFFNDDIYIPDQIIHTGDTDTYMQFHGGDSWRVVTAGSERFHIEGASVVFNSDGHDADFRVESDSLTHALYVDGGNNTVGIGSSGMPVYSGAVQLSLGPMAHFMAETTSGVDRSLHISQNAHLDTDGSWETMETDQASNYFQSAGTHNFRVASSTSAGTDITWITPLSISANGQVTMPNQPAFLVTPSSTQSNITNNGTQQQIAFGTEIFDQSSNFASNVFTAPVTGKYQFNISLYLTGFDVSANYYAMYITTSNRNYELINTGSVSGTVDPVYRGFAWSCLADMDANDTAQIAITQSGGAAQTDNTIYSRFSGFLVC